MAELTPSNIDIVLANRSSPDGNIRKMAEAELENWMKQPAALITAMTPRLHEAETDMIREQAALTLISLFKPPCVEYRALSDTHRAQIKAHLINAMSVNASRGASLQRQIANVIGQAGIAEIVHEDSGPTLRWPELFQMLDAATQNTSHSPDAWRSLIGILHTLSGSIGPYITISPFDQVPVLLRRCVQDVVPIAQRIRAANALATLVSGAGDDHKLAVARESNAAQLVAGVFQQACAIDNEENMLDAIVAMNALPPFVFKSHFGELMEYVLRFFVPSGAVTADQLDDKFSPQFQETTLMFICGLSEVFPKLAAKLPALTKLFDTGLRWCQMYEIADDFDNVHTDDFTSSDSMRRWAMGLMIFDRLPAILDGSKAAAMVSAVVMPVLVTPAGSSSTAQKIGALWALAQSVEACAEQYTADIGPLLGLILPWLGDADKAVRFSVCVLLQHMVLDMGADFAVSHGTQVLTALLPLARDDPSLRVSAAAHTAASLLLQKVKVADDDESDDDDSDSDESEACLELAQLCPGTLLQTVLDVATAAIGRAVGASSPPLLKEALQTLECAANCASSEMLVPVLPMLAGGLFSILERDMPVDTNKCGVDAAALKSSTLSCISLVGMRVGREAFGTNLQKLVALTQSVLENTSEDSTLRETLVTTIWPRFVTLLGADFGELMPQVMGEIVRMLRMSDFEVVDSSVEGAIQVKHGSLLDMSIKPNTIATNQKHSALDLVDVLFRVLPVQTVAPYAVPLMREIVPLLEYLLNPTIRHAAGSSLVSAICCIIKAARRHATAVVLHSLAEQGVIGLPEVPVAAIEIASAAAAASLQMSFQHTITPLLYTFVLPCLRHLEEELVADVEDEAWQRFRELLQALPDHFVDPFTESIVVPLHKNTRLVAPPTAPGMSSPGSLLQPGVIPALARAKDAERALASIGLTEVVVPLPTADVVVEKIPERLKGELRVRPDAVSQMKTLSTVQVRQELANELISCTTACLNRAIAIRSALAEQRLTRKADPSAEDDDEDSVDERDDKQQDLIDVTSDIFILMFDEVCPPVAAYALSSGGGLANIITMASMVPTATNTVAGLKAIASNKGYDSFTLRMLACILASYINTAPLVAGATGRLREVLEPGMPLMDTQYRQVAQLFMVKAQQLMASQNKIPATGFTVEQVRFALNKLAAQGAPSKKKKAVEGSTTIGVERPPELSFESDFINWVQAITYGLGRVGTVCPQYLSDTPEGGHTALASTIGIMSAIASLGQLLAEDEEFDDAHLNVVLALCRIGQAASLPAEVRTAALRGAVFGLPCYSAGDDLDILFTELLPLCGASGTLSKLGMDSPAGRPHEDRIIAALEYVVTARGSTMDPAVLELVRRVKADV